MKFFPCQTPASASGAVYHFGTSKIIRPGVSLLAADSGLCSCCLTSSCSLIRSLSRLQASASIFFSTGTPLATKAKSETKHPLLQVRPIDEDLLRRINMAAEAEGLTQAQFVTAVMRAETKDMEPVQEARRQRRKKRELGEL
jgi:hypothetical protein